VLFSRRWQRLAGLTDEQMRQGGGPAVALVSQAVLTVITAIVLGVIVSWSGASNLVAGGVVGGILGLGIVVTESLKLVFFERRSFELFLINNGLSVIALLVMGAIIGAAA